ncbi:MAG: response regulator transcription factor [Proteobacteria bacterium]|jgi:two-component system phosphate regulon response regulator OmpR|nr:response regulator transcription factor [Alphaproteobacteria bacterium]NCC02658.1 response regulator transcription factor [Pseudomonadota bacterium]
MTNISLSPALKPHILVVDDDDRLRELLRLFLAENGFIVSTASGGAEARGKLASLAYDLVVLDVMMPGESGLELAFWIRREALVIFREIPILFLTARAEAQERIEGLETGADDYMTKPFEPRELLLRINAILRRLPKSAHSATLSELKLGRWLYVPARDELRSGEESLRLTDMEASLMRVLAAEPGVVVSREVLGERTGKGATINDRTIDVQVTRLRRKIEGDTKNPRYLVTVRGEGYMLMPDMD